MMSISDRVDHRCRVVLDQYGETGADLQQEDDEKLKLNRVGMVLVLKCTVTKDLICENNSAFSRQGLRAC